MVLGPVHSIGIAQVYQRVNGARRNAFTKDFRCMSKVARQSKAVDTEKSQYTHTYDSPFQNSTAPSPCSAAHLILRFELPGAEIPVPKLPPPAKLSVKSDFYPRWFENE